MLSTVLIRAVDTPIAVVVHCSGADLFRHRGAAIIGIIGVIVVRWR